jgi:hypothetical protein
MAPWFSMSPSQTTHQSSDDSMTTSSPSSRGFHGALVSNRTESRWLHGFRYHQDAMVPWSPYSVGALSFLEPRDSGRARCLGGPREMGAPGGMRSLRAWRHGRSTTEGAMALGVSWNQETKLCDEPVSWEIMRCFVNTTSMVTWPAARFGRLGAKAHGRPRLRGGGRAKGS